MTALSRRNLLGVPLVLLLPACGPSKPLPSSASLKIPHLRQETLLCVPTAAAMVLAYYGDPQSPRRLKALASGSDYSPGEPFTDYSITPYVGLISGLERLGYQWEQVTLPQTEDGFRSGISLIEADLADGRLRWRRFSVQFGGLAKVGSGSDYAASLCSGLALSGASPG
jgi:hypothetical protein